MERKNVKTEERKETSDVPSSPSHYQQNGDPDSNAKRWSKDLGDQNPSTVPSESSGARTSQVMDVMTQFERKDGFQKREEVAASQGEGVALQGEGVANHRHNRYVTRHTTGNQITSSGDVDSSNQSSMSDNIVKLRIRANSTDGNEELMEAGRGGRTWSMGSNSETEERTWSIGSAGITSPGHSKNAAPMASVT